MTEQEKLTVYDLTRLLDVRFLKFHKSGNCNLPKFNELYDMSSHKYLGSAILGSDCIKEHSDFQLDESQLVVNN